MRPLPPAARRSRRPPVLAGLLLLAAAIACGGDTASEAGSLQVSTEERGDTLVVRTLGDLAPAEELQLVEQWRAGSADGDEATSFARIHSVGITTNGDVLVFDAGGPVLRRYDATGALVRAIGRKGSGPGEYDRVNGVAVLTDGRTVIWDGAGNSRLNVYSAADSFLTQWTSPITGFNTSTQSLLPLFDGRLSVRAYVRDTSLEREALGRTAWFVYDADGGMRDTISNPAPNEQSIMLVARQEGSVSSRPVPYQPNSVAALHPDGFVAWGPGEPYVLHARHAGRPLRIERSAAPIPVTDEERSQTREQVIWGMRMTDPAWTWDGPDIPDRKPAVRGLLVTLDGQYLVSVSTPSEPFEPDPPRVVEGQTPQPQVRFRSRTAYEIFAADGTLRGRFTLPFGAAVHALRGNEVWGSVTDEDDVPWLVHWTLEAPVATP